MDYAVIKLAGTQYVVSPGDILEVNSLGKNQGEEFDIKDVFLWKNGTDVQIGAPLVSGKTVQVKVLDNLQGTKIDVIKFKAKSRYRRKMGFRAQLTKIQVLPVPGKPASEDKKETAAKAPSKKKA